MRGANDSDRRILSIPPATVIVQRLDMSSSNAFRHTTYMVQWGPALQRHLLHQLDPDSHKHNVPLYDNWRTPPPPPRMAHPLVMWVDDTITILARGEDRPIQGVLVDQRTYF